MRVTRCEGRTRRIGFEAVRIAPPLHGTPCSVGLRAARPGRPGLISDPKNCLIQRAFGFSKIDNWPAVMSGWPSELFLQPKAASELRCLGKRRLQRHNPTIIIESQLTARRLCRKNFAVAPKQQSARIRADYLQGRASPGVRIWSLRLTPPAADCRVDAE